MDKKEQAKILLQHEELQRLEDQQMAYEETMRNKYEDDDEDWVTDSIEKRQFHFGMYHDHYNDLVWDDDMNDCAPSAYYDDDLW